MLNHHTNLRCSHRTATFMILTILALFLLIGCASLFRSAGSTDEEAQHQTALLEQALANATEEAINDITSGLAQGHDLKAIAARASTAFLWKLGTIGASTIGVLLTGLLGRLLGKEKKITKAIIKGVESSGTVDAKKAIYTKAIDMGVEDALHKRVKALT